MSQFSIAQAIALTKASLQKLFDSLGIKTPVSTLSSECISLTDLQDEVQQTARNARVDSLTKYHAHLEQHQANLAQQERMKAISAAETLACADATLAALEGEASIAVVAKQWDHEQIQASVGVLHQARKNYLEGDHSSALRKANQSVRKLTTALHSAYNRLAEAHRTVLSESVSGALSDLGYTIDKAADGGRLACWGHKWGNGMFGQGLLSETSVAVVIREDGKLAIDMSGFEGGQCEVEMHRFLERLKERGIQIKREEVVPHLRKDGGQLIHSANGKAASDLLQADAHCTSPVSHQARRSNSRRTDKQEADNRYKAASAWLWMQQKG